MLPHDQRRALEAAALIVSQPVEGEEVVVVGVDDVFARLVHQGNVLVLICVQVLVLTLALLPAAKGSIRSQIHEHDARLESLPDKND